MTTSDPDLTISVPQGWTPIPVPTYRAQLEEFAARMTDPGAKESLAAQVAKIDAGELRVMARGTTGPVCASSPIALWVSSSTGSLEEDVTTWYDDLLASSATVEIESKDPVTLQPGPALRVETSSDIPGGVPSLSVQFFVSLPGKRVAIVGGTAPATNTEFPALIDAVAESLVAK
jgi:hypothetical protein